VPVTAYRSLAEKFECILICSNNSRNGPVRTTVEAEEAVVQDVMERFAVASDQLFISGFSGGARASAHLSQQRRIYAGIIACGAAFVPNDRLTQKDSTPFAEIVGNEDMNFSEALETKQYLETINYPHFLFIFEGVHEWPPAAVYDMAIFWQLAQLHKRTRLGISDALIRDNENKLRSLVRQEIDSGDVYLAYLNLTQAILFSKSSPSLDSLQQQLRSNPLLTAQQNEFYKLLKKEEEARQQCSVQFSLLQGASADSAFKETYWKSLIDRQNKLIKSKSRQEALTGKRMEGWMRMASYEQYRSQFQAADYLHATLTARVYAILVNDYPSYLMLARAYAAREMRKQALKSLKRSVDLGLKQRKAIENDKFFIILRDDKAYQDILKSIDAKQK
jgi:hypothetical protein